VLCVDNEHSILEGMAQLLEGWSCEVLTATDTVEALEALEQAAAAGPAARRFPPGRRRYGPEDHRQAVRARWGDVPAVIITADYGEAVRERVRASAGCSIMRKPVKPAALRAIMSQLLLARRQSARDAAALGGGAEPQPQPGSVAPRWDRGRTNHRPASLAGNFNALSACDIPARYHAPDGLALQPRRAAVRRRQRVARLPPERRSAPRRQRGGTSWARSRIS
jgi:CheY-like chemotaxis protein